MGSGGLTGVAGLSSKMGKIESDGSGLVLVTGSL